MYPFSLINFCTYSGFGHIEELTGAVTGVCAGQAAVPNDVFPFIGPIDVDQKAFQNDFVPFSDRFYSSPHIITGWNDVVVAGMGET